MTTTARRLVPPWMTTTTPEDSIHNTILPSSSANKFAMMRHKCTGCASGICRERNLPISGVYDLHDGDTASTSGSIFTNSVIDKS